MATTIKQLKDKSGNIRLIAPVKMNHTMKWTVSGMVSGTSTLTNLDGSSGMEINIVLDKETASVPAKCITGTMLESQIGDGVVTYYKLGADVYTFAVVEGSGKLLTSGGAYSKLVRTTGTQTISGTKTFSSTTYSPEFRCEKKIGENTFSTAWRIGSSNGVGYLLHRLNSDDGQAVDWNVLECIPNGQVVTANGEWTFKKQVHATCDKAILDGEGNDIAKTYQPAADANLGGWNAVIEPGQGQTLPTWTYGQTTSKTIGGVTLPGDVGSRSRARGIIFTFSGAFIFDRAAGVSLQDINVLFGAKIIDQSYKVIAEATFDAHGDIDEMIPGTSEAKNMRTINCVALGQIPITSSALYLQIQPSAMDAPKCQIWKPSGHVMIV